MHPEHFYFFLIHSRLLIIATNFGGIKIFNMMYREVAIQSRTICLCARDGRRPYLDL